jgi:phosphatidylinositol-3-phosphatase
MKFLGLKAAIIVLGAGAVVAVPILVLGHQPVRPIGAAVRLVSTRGNQEGLKAQLQRLVAANPVATPSPTPTPPPSVAAPVGGPVGSSRPSQPALPPASAGAVPALSHVFVIVMENHEYGSIIGSGAAPYINSLANSYGLAMNYYGASHPSLPNYLALTAGSTFGIASDCTTCYVNATNIADQVEASGRSWRAYMEDMPSPCFMGGWSGNYAMKHDPFMYYTDIRNNAARCAAHVVPFSRFWGDMSSGQVPNFVWITPNLCNDMHDCGVATGDAWLRSVVPTITGSAAFRNGGALFITFDEGSTSAGCCGDSWGGHVATIVVSSRSIPGFRSGVAENHYGLLRTVEDALRLGHLNAAGWSSNQPLREYFR